MANILLLACFNRHEINDDQGITSISSFLRGNGHNIKMSSIFDDTNLSQQELFEQDIIGISAYHDTLPIAYKVAKIIKKQNPSAIICLGGYSATHYYTDILNDCIEIDVIIRGEGEEVFNELCNLVANKLSFNNIYGIAYRNLDNEIVANPLRAPIENLYKNYETKKDNLLANNLKLGQISSSRGCFGNCSFCYLHKYFDPSGNKKWRGKSALEIVNEIRILNKSYGFNRIYFSDASFEDSVNGNQRMEEIADLLIEENLPLSFCVNFRTSIIKRTTNQLIEKLKLAGLSGVFLGVEALNESDLELYNKRVTITDNIDAICYFRNMKIGVDIGFINFNPYSSIATIKQNANLLYKYGYIGSFIFSNKLRAYKGTAIYKKIENDGLLVNENYLDYFCYEYINKPIKLLEKYITDFTIEMNTKNNNQIQSIHFFYMKYSQILAHYKMILVKQGIILDDLFYENENKFNSIIEEHNDAVYFWYNELIELANKGWNTETAEKITLSNNLVSENTKYLYELKKLYFYLNKRILKYDKNITMHHGNIPGIV